MRPASVSIDKPRRPILLVGLAVLAIVSFLAWWALKPDHPTGSEAERSVSSGPTASPFGAVRDGAAPPVSDAPPAWMAAGSGAASGGTPTPAPSSLPDLTAEEWAALKEVLKDQPNAEAEIRRLVEFARFQKGFERWQSLREEPGSAQARAEIASELLRLLPDHVRRQEVIGGEALMLQAALLEDAEPDPARREVRRQELAKEVETVTAEQSRALQAQESVRQRQQQQFETLQADIIRRCRSQPGGCDQKTLEAQLEAARQSVFAN